MKRILLLSAVLLISTTIYSQSCPPTEPLKVSTVTGTWEGAYSSSGQFVPFVLKLTEAAVGLKASIDIPSEKVKGISYEADICTGQELHLKSTSVGSSVEFIGRPNADGIMTGRVIFKEGGGSETREVFTAKRS
ncbi:MAG: hypothetical protein RLO12_16260 [Fulvivirga sp.]